MSDDDVNSVRYYDRNAERFAADTGDLDMSALHERFFRYVPAGGRILDAGCGVGRDALAFAQRGYSVLAFDASPEMVRIAKERTAGRVEVLRMNFDEIGWREEFESVWACASLLHVPADELPAIVRRLAVALRPGGACYMSFKYGSGERIAGGRRFTDLTESDLNAMIYSTGLVIVDAWVTSDVRAKRSGEYWLNAVATKPMR